MYVSRSPHAHGAAMSPCVLEPASARCGRRGLAFVHLTAGAILLDGGRAVDAMAELLPGLLIARELGETQLCARPLEPQRPQAATV